MLGVPRPPPLLPPRVPPPPPPRPPRHMGPHIPSPTTAAVIEAAPSIVKPKPPSGGQSASAGVGKSAPTIEAKPQLRNMRKEVTKLVPTALKVRREANLPAGKAKRAGGVAAANFGPHTGPGTHPAVQQQAGQQAQNKPSSDDAYAQFMQEMHGFL